MVAVFQAADSPRRDCMQQTSLLSNDPELVFEIMSAVLMKPGMRIKPAVYARLLNQCKVWGASGFQNAIARPLCVAG